MLLGAGGAAFGALGAQPPERGETAEAIHWEAQPGAGAPAGAPAGARHAVVFLHGLTGSGRYWRADHPDRSILPAADLYFPDLLGFGRSGWPPGGNYTVEEHLSALRHWASAQGVVGSGGAVALVGHSLGAVLALEWAARFPEEISGLFLIGLPHYPDAAEARRCIGRASLMNRLTMAWEPGARAACWSMCLVRPLLVQLLARAGPLLAPRLPAAVAADGALHNWPSLERTLKRCIAEHRVSASAAAVARRAAGGFPVFLLHGAEDRVAPVGHVRGLAGRTGLPLSVIAGAGHDLWLSQWESALRALRVWSAGVNEGVSSAAGTAASRSPGVTRVALPS